jgi:tellurite resistance protein
MDQAEQLEVLRAVLAVAIADGTTSRGEKGVVQKLAARAGVDAASLDEIVKEARSGPVLESQMFRPVLKDPATAMRLLVATAQIDGEITEEERSVLVDISLKVGVPPDRFGQVFAEGVALADRLRQDKSRKKK